MKSRCNLEGCLKQHTRNFCVTFLDVSNTPFLGSLLFCGSLVLPVPLLYQHFLESMTCLRVCFWDD